MLNSDKQATTIHRNIQTAIDRLQVTSGVRDKALSESRQIVRLSANAIRSLHRGDYTRGDHLISQGGERLGDLVSLSMSEPTVYWAGYVQDAMKEHVEATTLAAILREEQIPDAANLKVELAPYLNGLSEAASELRRQILDRLRLGEVRKSEDYFSEMEAIYEALISVDFPDAMTGGLRRATDQLRGVVERTRADLTLATRQLQLERALRGQVDQFPAESADGIPDSDA